MSDITAITRPEQSPHDEGERLSLLLLPGLLCDQRLWQAQVTGLANRARCTVADLTGANTIGGLAESALAQAPPGRFALAGFSLGGYVALEIMRQAPERVLALALLDTSARPDTPEATAARHELLRRASPDLGQVIATLLPRLLHPAHLTDATLVGLVGAMARSIGRDAFVRQVKAIIGRPDSAASLGRIACPTLVLCGSDDALTPVEVHAELVAGIPGARLQLIETAGHLTPLEQPHAVTAALSAWLEATPR